MIRVLHILTSLSFFNTIFGSWERVGNFENQAIYLGNNDDPKLMEIEYKDKLQVLTYGDLNKCFFHSLNYDVVFFHSLTVPYYKIINYIPEDKIVIWWCWGYDVYYVYRDLEPLINLKLYKPQTLEYTKKEILTLRDRLSKIKWFFLKPLSKRLQKQILQRIDYFQPVLKIEYRLMCNNTDFHNIQLLK